MNNPKETNKPTPLIRVIAFWLYVDIPLAWGVWSTVKKALALLGFALLRPTTILQF